MKLQVLGSHLCTDTLFAVMKLKEKNIDFDFVNLSADLSNLKKFLVIRETDELYENVRKNGGIGIPLFIKEDGTTTLDLNEIL